jgi:hypothetical protein
MKNIDDLKFYIGPYGENRWLALSQNSPYFCFEADSEEALEAKCRKALAFLRKAYLEPEGIGGRKTQPFRPTKIRSAKELEYA